MVQKQFVQDGDYRVGDTVIVMEKQYKITGISGSVATLTRRDGTGQKEEQKMKLTDLPQKDMTVLIDDSPAEEDEVDVVEAPTYEKGQTLANGWEVVRPSVRDKYMVRINGSQQEMTGHMIHTAVRDYQERMAQLEEEKRTHEQAEAFAQAKMIEHYEQQERLEKVSSVKGEDADGSLSVPTVMPQDKADVLKDVLQKLDDVAASIKRIDAIEDRIARQFIDLEKEQAHHRREMEKVLNDKVDGIDARMREIEKHFSGEAAAPILPTRIEEPEVEVMTRVQNLEQNWDKELEKLLNDGWKILFKKVLSDSKRSITFVRPRQELIEVDDGEEIRILEIPTSPRVVSGKIAITDVTEKYAGLSGEALVLAQRFDAEIDANTRNIMGGEWYGKYGA